MAGPEPRRFKHGLSFLATLAFVGGFFGARLFHLAFPGLMITIQGIHFHHFWYGVLLVGVSGWLGLRGSLVWGAPDFVGRAGHAGRHGAHAKAPSRFRMSSAGAASVDQRSATGLKGLDRGIRS